MQKNFALLVKNTKRESIFLSPIADLENGDEAAPDQSLGQITSDF